MLELVSAEEAAKYAVYMVRSFVEDNGAMCWCTGKVRGWACGLCCVCVVRENGGGGLAGTAGLRMSGWSRGKRMEGREDGTCEGGPGCGL